VGFASCTFRKNKRLTEKCKWSCSRRVARPETEVLSS
jgi:hypothetical protein